MREPAARIISEPSDRLMVFFSVKSVATVTLSAASCSDTVWSERLRAYNPATPADAITRGTAATLRRRWAGTLVFADRADWRAERALSGSDRLRSVSSSVATADAARFC